MLKALSLTLRAMSVCVSIRQQTLPQHTSAYVSIRQHTCVCEKGASEQPCVSIRFVSICQHMPAYVSIRQYTCVKRARLSSHTSAYVSSAFVSICQHTSAYVSIPVCEKGASEQPCALIGHSTRPRRRTSSAGATSCPDCDRAYVSIRQHTSAAYVS